MDEPTLVLRLAGPLQSWGSSSEFNRRETDPYPTKAGVVGLLAAADGRRRSDPIEDLVGLRLGVRQDQPGQLLRDYHTVSDLTGRPMLSASVNSRGAQTLTSPKKFVQPTVRYYLGDAVFVVAVGGPVELLEGLAYAVRHPAFPLALGRRACAPTQPLLLTDGTHSLWSGGVPDVLTRVPWQAGPMRRRSEKRSSVELAMAWDDPEGDDIRVDVPVSFNPVERRMRHRRVRHGWATLNTGVQDGTADDHDPFFFVR